MHRVNVCVLVMQD